MKGSRAGGRTKEKVTDRKLSKCLNIIKHCYYEQPVCGVAPAATPGVHLPHTRPRVREILGLKSQQKGSVDLGISSGTRKGTLLSGPFLLHSPGGTTWTVQPFEKALPATKLFGQEFQK